VARQGIQRLRAAAELADEHEHRRIQPRDVVNSAERAEHRIRELSLRSLPYHHQVVYALVYRAAPVTSQALHDRYDVVADDVYQGRPVEPISRRSRRNKLQKLRAYDLLDVRETNGREHIVVDEAVTPQATLDTDGRRWPKQR
jgi:Cdc6-like AAA superfamily ATPase